LHYQYNLYRLMLLLIKFERYELSNFPTSQLRLKSLKLATLAVFLLGMFACSEDFSESLDPINEANENREVTLRSSVSPLSATPPTLNNDVLEFTDSTHFFTFYEELSNLSDTDDSLFVEAMLSYSVTESDTFENVFYKLLYDEFSDPNNRYQPFLSNTVLAAIVNEHFEFVVGNAMYTVVNNERILMSDPNDATSKTALRALTKGDEISVSQIPSNTYWVDIADRGAFGEDIANWCGCAINIRVKDCDNVEVWGNCKGFWGFNDGSGTVSICNTPDPNYPSFRGDWGPASIWCDDYNVDGNFSFTVPFQGSGIRYIHARSISDCITNDVEIVTLEYEDGVTTACDYGFRSTPYHWRDNSGQGMSFRVFNYKDYTGHYEKAECYPKHWSSGPTTWKQHKAFLEVKIDAERGDFECSGSNNYSEEKTKRKYSNYLSAKVDPFPPSYGWGGAAHCDNTPVLGSFKKKKSGITVEWNNETLDFQCCD